MLIHPVDHSSFDVSLAYATAGAPPVQAAEVAKLRLVSEARKKLNPMDTP